MTVSVALQPAGFIVDVVLRPLGSGEHLNVRGLLDTGASDVCIDYRMAEQLGLREIDQQQIGTASGSVLARVFLGMLQAPRLGFSEPMRLYTVRAKRQSHDILLGRSFLSNFVVTFDGPAEIARFERPATHSEEWDG